MIFGVVFNVGIISFIIFVISVICDYELVRAICILLCIASIILMFKIGWKSKNILDQLDYTSSIEYSQEIFAVKDNSDTSGSIRGGLFYTAGYIGTDLYYYCVGERDGGKYIIKFPAETSTIYECEDNFRVECWENYKQTKESLWVIELRESVIYYKLYVPVGTMTTEFNINLE